MPANGLPTHSAIQEKIHRTQGSWGNNRRLRILDPVSRPLQGLNVQRFQRKRGPLFICIAFVAVFMTVVLVRRGSGESEAPFIPTVGDPPTLVFQREDLQKIWTWEIDSGHYPSRRSIPKEIGFRSSPINPAIPSKRRPSPSRYRPPEGALLTNEDADTVGTGPKRIYLDIQSQFPNVAYPPRPVPNSIADMDVIMKHCDFGEGKYVRDCLEVLRLGGGLDNGMRTRRGSMDDWKYIYLEQETEKQTTDSIYDPIQPKPVYRPIDKVTDPNAGLQKKYDVPWEPQVVLPSAIDPRPHYDPDTNCDPNNPRLYHMFWTGPFTDKPYLALMSFLFTQNTGIHLDEGEQVNACQPQFWLWINPGPAAAVPNPNALHDMFEQLKRSPWASPFLHPRFKDVIKFKMWNTTEQLDGVPEIKDEWRGLSDSLFNSGGHIMSVPKKAADASDTANGTTTTAAADDDIANRLGSKSSSSYDRLSVILSDMARFVLCHRFGGIYLDADTIFLRDWEELWGWKGAFAYRWSRLEKYNTAVLRMNRHSALGTFLFRSALKNGLDFHPMTISRYMADAHLAGLLLRLPDALFDSAWLNTEWYQRDRPPQPYFQGFQEFFDTPAQGSAAPQALGFDGFFKGAYSYHFHNYWWKPFDPVRNYPDLGPRFIAGERQARIALKNAEGKPATSAAPLSDGDIFPDETVDDDKRDLDWSTVMKRTFESYVRGERPNMYGEWIRW